MKDLMSCKACEPTIYIIDGCTCFIIDDHIKYDHMYLRKSESFERFKEFKNEVEIYIGKSIKILWSNQISECFNQVFKII